MPPADVRFVPVTKRDFPVLRELAETIWRQHYAGIISAVQIDYMLAERFSDEVLREHVQAADTWLELLRVSGTPVGYCGHELASMDGNEASPAAMKLGQRYVLESHRGMGLGRFMLGLVEGWARELGRRLLWLPADKARPPISALGAAIVQIAFQPARSVASTPSLAIVLRRPAALQHADFGGRTLGIASFEPFQAGLPRGFVGAEPQAESVVDESVAPVDQLSR